MSSEYERGYERERGAQAFHMNQALFGCIALVVVGLGLPLVCGGLFIAGLATTGAKAPPEPERPKTVRREPRSVTAEPPIRASLPPETDGSSRSIIEPPAPKIRTWHAAVGSFSVDAEFLSMAGGNVKLRKADGSEISVQLDKLSEDDQQWIRGYARSKAR